MKDAKKELGRLLSAPGEVVFEKVALSLLHQNTGDLEGISLYCAVNKSVRFLRGMSNAEEKQQMKTLARAKGTTPEKMQTI